MAYKRTSKNTGGIKRTQTYNTKTGKTTNSYSYKSGNTRYTQSSNGKSYITTSLGNGYYDTKVSGPKKIPKKTKATQSKRINFKPLTQPRTRRTKNKSSGSSAGGLGGLILLIIVGMFILFSKSG